MTASIEGGMMLCLTKNTSEPLKMIAQVLPKMVYLNKKEIFMETHLKVRSPKLMAFVLMAGAFIGLFSETALNMALTDIMGQFSIDQTVAQWVTTGYLLVLAIFVPISAFLVRWFTTKQLVVAGLLLSLVGALLGALAVNFPMLMAGRVVQAIGTGIIIPVMNIVVLMIFPVAKRGVSDGGYGISYYNCSSSRSDNSRIHH